MCGEPPPAIVHVGTAALGCPSSAARYFSVSNLKSLLSKLFAYDQNTTDANPILPLRPNLGPLLPRTRPTSQSQKTSHPPPSPQRPRTRSPLGTPPLPSIHDGSSRIPSLASRALNASLLRSSALTCPRPQPKMCIQSHATPRVQITWRIPPHSLDKPSLTIA
jgi:hypothetical protein